MRAASVHLSSRVFASVALAVLVSGLLGPACKAPPRIKAPPKETRTIPNTDVNPFGATFFLQWEVEPWKVEKTLQMAKEAGIGWVKQQFPWEDIEPEKGKFWYAALNKSTWEKYDRIVELARKYGLQIIARLDRPPDWTRQDNTRKERPPDNLEDYGNFVYAVASRYQGKIRYYQIWNEPNIWPEWGDRPVDPTGYVELLRTAYQRIKEADPNAYVLSAPLAQTLEDSPRNMSDLKYLDLMYQHGAKDYFDILFANAYGFSLPPDDPPDPRVLNFQRVVLLHQVMERYGDGNKAVWFNEFGWNASPEEFPPEKLTWGRVTEQQQAEYTVAAIDKARAEWPWAGVFCIWYFRQAGQISSGQSEYYFRMVDVGFTPRLVYYSVQKASASVGVAGIGRHQETSPAVAMRGDWQLVVETRADQGAMLVSQNPSDNLTITFWGTELSLVALKSPSSGMLLATLDGREANRLSRDRQGRSYLNLRSDEEEWQAVVPIASGLSNDQHTLRLVVAPPSDGQVRIVIDGFVVAEAQGQNWWGPPPLVWVGAIVAAAIGLALWRRARANRGGS